MIKVGDKIRYHYHVRNKSKQITDRKEYFGFCVAVDRPDETFTVIWWDGYGNQFSNRDATIGKNHRQFEAWDNES